MPGAGTGDRGGDEEILVQGHKLSVINIRWINSRDLMNNMVAIVKYLKFSKNGS